MLTLDVLATDYPAGRRIAPHAHGVHQIVHAGRGVMRVMSEAGAWVVPPGRVIWMPARTTHWIDCFTAVEMRTVYLGGDHPVLPEACAVWSVSPLMREVLLRLVSRERPDQEAALLELLLSEIETVDQMPLSLPIPEDRRLRRITEALQSNPGDSRDLTSWAREAGATPRTLIRLFRRETGMTFREWRRQLRLQAALERLARGEAVTSVALDLGYASPSAFIQAFRDVLGTTPARYFER